MVVGETSWSHEDDAGKVQIANREKCLDETDAGVTGTNDDDSGILNDLWLGKHPSGGEAESEWSLLFVERVSAAAINLVLDVILLFLLDILGDESLVVPLAVKEMRESSGADVNKLMEDSWDDSLCVNLEVKACLLGQPQELLQHEASRLLEDWVDARVN